MRIYWKLIGMNFRAGLQYRGWWLMIPHTLFIVVTDPLGLILMFSRFGSIGEWTVERILLIYAMAVTSFGLAETFCRGFDYFPFKMVQGGAFDRVLLRPCSLTVQVAGSYFHLHRLSRVVSGISAMLWCLWKQGIDASVPRVSLLVTALLGGFLMYVGVFIGTSGIAFFTIQGVDWIYIFTNASYQVTRCPSEYLPRALKSVFTFFLPVLVISYYPASVVCGWGEPVWKGLLALPAGALFLGFSFLLWNFGVRHYKSTGS